MEEKASLRGRKQAIRGTDGEHRMTHFYRELALDKGCSN